MNVHSPGNPAASAAHTPAHVSALISAHRFRWASERDLQDALEVFLTLHYGAGAVAREVDLSPHGRVDFFLPEARTAVEVKVDGAASTVLRQLAGYARHPAVSHLILVSTCARHRGLPAALNDKPVHVVALWRNL